MLIPQFTILYVANPARSTPFRDNTPSQGKQYK